jgi:hypothetical protein
MTPSRAAGTKAAIRRQLSSLYGLFVLSMRMFEARDEEDILRLASSSVASLGGFVVGAAYLIERGKLRAALAEPVAGDVDGQVAALEGSEGAISLSAHAWAWAYPLRSRAGLHGYLVLASELEPSEDARFLIKVLVQQTAVAVANASLYHGALASAAELQSLSDERARANRDLTRSVDELARQTRPGCSGSGVGERTGRGGNRLGAAAADQPAGRDRGPLRQRHCLVGSRGNRPLP